MPSEWLTWSGRPDSSVTASDPRGVRGAACLGDDSRSADARTATVPPMRRTFSSVTSSNSSAVGASTVQWVIAVLLGGTSVSYRPRYVVSWQSQDVSRLREAFPGSPALAKTGNPGRHDTHPLVLMWGSFLFSRAGGRVPVGAHPHQPFGEPVHGRLELRVQVD